MTRADILNELNKLTVHYNLRWEDIKTDADKAIYEINRTLGASFPEMTYILLNDNSTYTERVGSLDRPIIAREYILSVIIPYIAMEVLARDEEFTTVFSKYQQEYHNGLYQMLSREFNHIPNKYRRQDVQGVFFPSSNQGKNKFSGYSRRGKIYPKYLHNYGTEDNEGSDD